MHAPPPRTAVLFKTHFWDAFCERQFARLCERAAGADVFVVVDESNGPVAGIAHDRVIPLTEAQAEAEGYFRYPKDHVFWYNTDYQLYQFLDRCPDYDIIVTCEYDCAITVEIATIVAAMHRRGLHFVGERIRSDWSTWCWAPLARPHYPNGLAIVGRLLSFAAFSHAFARQMQAARRAQTVTMRAGAVVGSRPDVIFWPNNEAFVGAELASRQIAEATLAEFGDTSHFDWAPPWPEAQLPGLRGFIHPVLDLPRWRAALQKHWHDPVRLVPLLLPPLRGERDSAELAQLRRELEARLGADQRGLFDVARGRELVPGTAVGTDWPWRWLDLQVACLVREIRIRADPASPEGVLASASRDLRVWHVLHDGVALPVTLTLPQPLELRYICLHAETAAELDGVRIELHV